MFLCDSGIGKHLNGAVDLVSRKYAKHIVLQVFCRSQLLNLAYTLRVAGVKLFMECLWSAEKLVLF